VAFHAEVDSQLWSVVDAGSGPSASLAGPRQHTDSGIGLKLGRTENAVRTKAAEQRISLKPTNQSPYGRRAR
jgi:hypothetical protein